MTLQDFTDALSRHMPPVLRWAGAIAQQLQRFDISVTGKKTSGSPSTDALTLADLSVQELLVAALRDSDPIFRHCRIQAEESTGDLQRFAPDGDYTIAIDPIDGTKQYRDRSGNGWCVMLHLRAATTVHYSLAYIPASGAHGTWVEAVGERLVCGDDDPNRPATEVLRTLPPIVPSARPQSKKIYLVGFQHDDPVKAQCVNDAGLEAYTMDTMPGCMYELFARGTFDGTLIHTPNVYDFPVTLHLARILGGEALWVHNQEPVNFRDFWLDDRADMLRLPGIVACSTNRATLTTLCDLAKDWDPVRYRA
jgi:3'(2'), 5'-bisphosphate nucleotidase